MENYPFIINKFGTQAFKNAAVAAAAAAAAVLFSDIWLKNGKFHELGCNLFIFTKFAMQR